MATRRLTYEEQHQLRKTKAKGSVKDREHLRLEIEARDILARMQASTMTLIQGYEEIQTPIGDVIQQPLSRERIAALKAASEIDKTLLDRVLPILKPVEIERPPDSLVNPADMTDNDLRTALADYLHIDPRLIPGYRPEDSEQSPTTAEGETLQ